MAGGDLLSVQHIEPGRLPKVGSLPANLEGHPLVTQITLFQSIMTKFVRGAILGGGVLDYSAGFPECEGGVGVSDGCIVSLAESFATGYKGMVPGTRPLGLISTKGLSFMDSKQNDSMSYSSSNSSRMKITF